MKDIDPRILLIGASLLLLMGFALPTLMIMQILKSTFFLNFLAYTASFVGLIMGLVGSLFLAIQRKGNTRMRKSG